MLFVLRGSTGNGKGDLAGISMELNQSSFGFLYNLTDDLDLEQGDGSRIGVGFSSVSSDSTQSLSMSSSISTVD